MFFNSRASDLVPGDTNQQADVFRRDLLAGTTELVSRGQDGSLGTEASTLLSLGTNGLRVLFRSLAFGLPAETNAGRLTDLVVRDLDTGRTRRLGFDAPPDTNRFLIDTGAAVMSADGRHVFFTTAPYSYRVGTNFTREPMHLVWHDLEAGTRTTLYRATNSTDSFLGGDSLALASGPTLVFAAPETAFELTSSRLYRWQPAGGLAPVQIGAPTTNGATVEAVLGANPTLSPDGTQLAFTSEAMLLRDTDPEIFRLYLLDLTSGAIRLLTRTPDGTPAGGAELGEAVFSDDGTQLVFSSQDDTLMADDRNQAFDLFATPAVTSDAPLELLSGRHPDRPEVTVPGAVAFELNSVSEDGRRVLFSTFADNYVAGDTNGVADAFVRDLDTGELILASANRAGTVGEGVTSAAVLSGDGRHVAFASTGSDLALNDANQGADVFLRELGGPLRLMSRARTNSGTTGDKPTDGPVSVSRDARWVMFRSAATDLVAGVTAPGLFLLDRETGSMSLVAALNPLEPAQWQVSQDGSTVLYAVRSNGVTRLHAVGTATGTRSATTNGLVAPGTQVSVSDNGARAVFQVRPAAGGNVLTLWDRAAGTETYLFDARLLLDARLSGDGRWLAYVLEEALPAGQLRLLYLRDLDTGRTELISRGRDEGRADGHSDHPLLSRDGRWLTFRSTASNLVAGDTNAATDIFVYDRELGQVTLVSRGADGQLPNENCARPILSADGNRVVFRSAADNLVPGDYNRTLDLFAATVPQPANTDHDTLPDAWELSMLGSLASSGEDDDDRDGVSNRAEYLAGTNPGDPASFLRLVAVQGTGATAGVTLRFASVAGVGYWIEAASPADYAFTILTPELPGTGTELSVPLEAAADGRVYRLRAMR